MDAKNVLVVEIPQNSDFSFEVAHHVEAVAIKTDWLENFCRVVFVVFRVQSDVNLRTCASSDFFEQQVLIHLCDTLRFALRVHNWLDLDHRWQALPAKGPHFSVK